MGAVQNRRTCDVLVVGGGPAGATIAALLAQKGRQLVVLEKDRFPRFHIGESLLPLNLPLFDRLGVADEVSRIGVYKPGAEVVSDEHAQATTFRFDHNPYLSIDHSYHVRRADFDKLLSTTAAASAQSCLRAHERPRSSSVSRGISK